MSKSNKPTLISLIDRGGWLYVAFSSRLFGGKQKRIALGLPDSPANRGRAWAKIAEIEKEIESGHFDYSLKKYMQRSQYDRDTCQWAADLPTLWNEYMAHATIKCKPSSLNEKNKLVTNRLKNWKRKQLTTQDVDLLFGELAATYVPNTLWRICKQLNTCGKWGVRSKRIEVNYFADFPAKAKDLIPVKSRKKPDPFSLDELGLIRNNLSALGKNCASLPLLFHIMAHTGMRLSEAIAVKWTDINFSKATIKVTRAVIDINGINVLNDSLKTQLHRVVPLSPALNAVLEPLPKHAGYIIGNGDFEGIPTYNVVRYNWDVFLMSLGIRARGIYSLRATFITHQVQAGISSDVIAKWVGNSPEIIHLHYLGDVSGVMPAAF